VPAPALSRKEGCHDTSPTRHIDKLCTIVSGQFGGHHVHVNRCYNTYTQKFNASQSFFSPPSFLAGLSKTVSGCSISMPWSLEIALSSRLRTWIQESPPRNLPMATSSYKYSVHGSLFSTNYCVPRCGLRNPLHRRKLSKLRPLLTEHVLRSTAKFHPGIVGFS
jgi:hypothetical protein